VNRCWMFNLNWFVK